jgi:hypothetical protein
VGNVAASSEHGPESRCLRNLVVNPSRSQVSQGVPAVDRPRRCEHVGCWNRKLLQTQFEVLPRCPMRRRCLPPIAPQVCYCLWREPCGKPPRCAEWRMDTQLVESINSSISIQLATAPASTLPLLSSRVVTRRYFAAERKSGRELPITLAELVSGHPEAVLWSREGGAARRFATPEAPFHDPAADAEPHQAPRARSAPATTAEAAATLSTWLSRCEECRSPTVEYAVGFGRTQGDSAAGGGLPKLTSLWFPVLRHYSQIWLVRLLPSGLVHVPLEFKKFLNVVQLELAHGWAKAVAVAACLSVSRGQLPCGMAGHSSVSPR